MASGAASRSFWAGNKSKVVNQTKRQPDGIGRGPSLVRTFVGHWAGFSRALIYPTPHHLPEQPREQAALRYTTGSYIFCLSRPASEFGANAKSFLYQPNFAKRAWMNRYRNAPGVRGPSKATASTLCQKCLKRDMSLSMTLSS
jgi:hypothetical protein